MADIAVARDWELLREVARLAQQDAQLALASTDPALFSSWRAAVTKYDLKGWTHMTPERVDAVRHRANSNKILRVCLRKPQRAPSSGGSANCARKSATSPPAMAYRGRTRMGAANDAALPRDRRQRLC